ncbi:MAG: HupE/UreJ family protein, partial [Methyloprofundus sp.]|nr:HupE/UreJ family protein [Methyloprofundus sp.]
ILDESEFQQHRKQIEHYVREHVQLYDNNLRLALNFTQSKILPTPQGSYLQLLFTTDPLSPLPETLDIHYSLLFENDALHRGLLVIEPYELAPPKAYKEHASLIFSEDQRKQTLDFTQPQPFWSLFISYFQHGIFHILIGYDHILFLVALLLVAVLERDNNRWQAVTRLRPALMNVLKIVTAFTVAHSMTLSLAAFQVISLPSRLVESTIALTVMLAALNNLLPLVTRRIVVIIFLFGLFHGFGFAGVLADLGFQQFNLLAPLLGFNLGVEVGQIAIVSLIMPVLYVARNQSFYVPYILQAGSILIALFGLVWFVERAFNLNLTDII